MTYPGEYLEDEPQQYDGPVIPVEDVNLKLKRSETAERVSYNTFTLNGASPNPQPTKIAPKNPKRRQVQIYLTNSVSSPKLVVHYDPGQLQSGGGAQISSASSSNIAWEFKNTREIWALVTGGAGAAITISVIDESYE